MDERPLARIRLPDSTDGRLVFAQVREDPLLEIEALAPGPSDTVVTVGSGGCTALSLLAAGAGHVFAVDLNATQNHLLELKRAAVARLGASAAVAFLGGAPAGSRPRTSEYHQVRDLLSAPARSWWDERTRLIERGALAAGTSERFIRIVAAGVRRLAQSPAKVERLLDATSLDEQRRIYEEDWDSRRWRALFAVLLNRTVIRRAYDPELFANVESPSFARHFRAVAEHTLTEIPIATNYFVHHMLTGRYPTAPGGLPPYLASDRWAGPESESSLTLVDGSITTWLRGRPDASVDAFALSNIGEWMDQRGLDELFAQVVRTARPRARLVFRNFVGWTEVSRRYHHLVREDRAAGEALISHDRSAVQRRIAVCRVRADQEAAL